MTRLHVGTRELRGTLEAYAKRFDLLEIRGRSAAERRLAPSAATLRKWRRIVPPHFEFSVVGGPAVGGLRPGEAFDAELESMLETARILESRLLVLATPSEVTPAQIWRDRLKRAVEKLPRDVCQAVWEPSGVWELEDASSLAASLGVTLAWDATRDELGPGPTAYVRLRALGGTRAYSVTALTNVLRNVGPRTDTYVVFETAAALKEAKSLRALVRSHAASAADAAGTVVRPRRALASDEDDE